MFDLARFKGDIDFMRYKNEISDSLYTDIMKLVRAFEDLKDDFKIMQIDYERVLGGDV